MARETFLSSRQHPLVKRYVKLREQRRFRYSEGRVVVEGAQVIGELLAQSSPHSLMIREGLPCPWDLSDYFRVSKEVLAKASGLEESSGYLAEFDLPSWANLSDGRRLVVLDQVQDPGNMGTILRTALAFGWDGAFLIQGSVDPFNAKSLQAGQGAAFRLPLAWGSWEEAEALGGEFFVADLEGQAVAEMTVPDRLRLVLGNEGQGVSSEALRKGRRVTLPMEGEMESLNVSVAAGILMYLMRT